MQMFSLPTRLIFGENALEALKNASLGRVLVVTDPFFEQNGTAAHIAALCGGESRIFSGVRPDPDMAQIAAGVAVLQQFAPDTLLALGGGSAIDCAKGILSLGQSKARLVAVPTTSGTGSEVTSFAVLTHNGVKYPLVEEGLRPAIAVLDPSLLSKLPAGLIADAGMDVLAHCLEAVAAKNATLFSDALAFFAFQTALNELPRSFAGSLDAREKVHCAATMAGIAFDHAGLGACHALSHALGGTFHLAHGRLNGILLPHVVLFNASCAAERYERLAAACHLSGTRGLLMALRRLRAQLHLPGNLREAGLERSAVLAAADEICSAAVKDPCTAANPRPVTAEDYAGLLRAAL